MPWDSTIGNIVFYGTDVYVSTYTYYFTWYVSFSQVILIIGGVMGIGYGFFLRSYTPDYEKLNDIKEKRKYYPQTFGRDPRLPRIPFENKINQITYPNQEIMRLNNNIRPEKVDGPLPQPEIRVDRGPIPSDPTGNAAIDKLKVMFDSGQITYNQYWKMRDYLE